MSDVLKGFKEFITRGNVVELAVAVVMGTAFTAVVTAVVDNILTPLIAMLFGKPNLNSAMILTINNADFRFGALLTELINFLLIAAAIYFFIIVPLNKLSSLRKKPEEAPAARAEDVVLLEEIRDLLRNQNNTNQNGPTPPPLP